MASLAHVQGQAQQLGRAFHFFAIDDARDAQVDLGEVVDGDGVGQGLAARRGGRRAGFGGGRLEQVVQQLGIDALHQVLERRHPLRQLLRVAPGEVGVRAEQLARHAAGQRGQHRRQHHRQGLEAGQRARADVLQAGARGRVGGADALGHHPGLRRVERLVDAVGMGHDFAHRAVVLARLEGGADRFGLLRELGRQRVRVAVVRQFAVEVAGNEGGGAAGDVDVLAHQVAVDTRHEVFGVEVHVLDARVQLGRHVVAQPFGVHADFQVAQRRDAGAAALGHLLAADGDETVHIQLVGRLAPGELQHRRPEQRVEVNDVLADEVHLLGRAGRVEQRVEVQALGRAIGFQRGQVAHRRVQPDIEILARRVGNLDAEIGGVARDIPVAQLGLAVVADQPFARLGLHFGLQVLDALAVGAGGPLLQELDAARIGQLEEEVIGRLQYRRGAGQGRIGVDQLGGRIHGAAHFTRIAVLVLGVAARAFALDVAVGQEHALDRVVELLDRACLDQSLALERAIDFLRERHVLGRIGAVPVVEADMEAVQVARPLGGVAGHQRLRRDAFLFGLEHDRRAVRVVGTHEMHRVARHAHRTDPDVGLDVLHDVADVERSVGVGQGSGDEERA
ncbi:Uncharacterised protein [Bordetella pertussis]|nr:Uncharacterised protein [Bordetella pertussis]